MNKILNEIKTIVAQNLELYLPHVKTEDLENDGAIFYMNGNNGTEFDWYVNDKISNFMVFYHDENNLSAIKLTLYRDGEIALYIYDEKGDKLVQEVHSHIEADEPDLFKLAVILRNEADNKKIWDADIESINTDIEIDTEKMDEFKDHEKDYDIMKNRVRILNLKSCVSQKIINDGWKVGYMERNEPINEEDSGWSFFAGNEDDEYLSDYHNIALISVGYVWQQLDADIFKHIDKPAGTKLIRISSEDFEIDQNDKAIFMEKR